MINGVGTGGSVSSHRLFVGLRNSAASATDVDPSTYTDIIGVGYDSADTQVQIMHNDASGTATKVALGSSFPKPTTADERVYELRLVAVGGATTVAYTVTDLSNGATASGTISTDLPSATTGMGYWTQMSAGGTSTAINLAFTEFRVRVG